MPRLKLSPFLFLPFALGLAFALFGVRAEEKGPVSVGIKAAQASCHELNKLNGECSCNEYTCGALKDCTAGWVPCNDRTPRWACNEHGEKCVYENDGDTGNDCPPEYCSPGGGGGDDDGGGGGGS